MPIANCFSIGEKILQQNKIEEVKYCWNISCNIHMLFLVAGKLPIGAILRWQVISKKEKLQTFFYSTKPRALIHNLTILEFFSGRA